METRSTAKAATPQTKPSYIDNATFNKSLAGYDNNTLIKGLCQIVGQEKTMQAVRMYGVGTAKDGATVFWQLDTDNKVRTGKIIHYKPDLHRNKDNPPYIWFMACGTCPVMTRIIICSNVCLASTC